MSQPVLVEVNTWKVVIGPRKRGDVLKACPHCGVIRMHPVRLKRCRECAGLLVRVRPTALQGYVSDD